MAKYDVSDYFYHSAAYDQCIIHRDVLLIFMAKYDVSDYFYHSAAQNWIKEITKIKQEAKIVFETKKSKRTT